MSIGLYSALNFLTNILFGFAIYLFLLRIVLQLVRAPFHNPLANFVWTMTNPIVAPLSRIVPRYKRFDTAAALVVVVIAIATIVTAVALREMYDRPDWNPATRTILRYAGFEILISIMNLYTGCLLVYAILSWVAPGTHTPISSILWSITEPMLRPLRRIIKPISGIDITPIIAIILLQFTSLLLHLPPMFR